MALIPPPQLSWEQSNFARPERPSDATLRLWNQYWFRPAALVDLAIGRIVIVGFQLLHLIALDYLDQIHKLAALPDALYQPLPILHFFTFPFGWDYRPSSEVMETVYWTTLAAGIPALVGFVSNLSLVVFALGNILLQAFLYSYGDFHHTDALMRITLFVLALSPAGGALSVDDLWRRLRQNTDKNRFEGFSLLAEESTSARWPLLLIRWLFALILLVRCR